MDSEKNDTFIYINDIIFDQLYIFAVRSESEYGNSKFSDDVACFLPKSIPPQPLQLRYSKLNETDIVVFWNLPEEYEFASSDSVVSFHVLYENIDQQSNRRLGPWSEILVDGVSHSAHLPTLSPRSDYRVTVTASNRAGVSGPPSEPLFVTMGRSSTRNSKLMENSGDGSRVIVVERKSYFEGLMLGICVAIILILIVLCIKIGRDETFNCRTPISFSGHRLPNDRCIKRNPSSSVGLEVRSCASKFISNELKYPPDFYSDRVGLKTEISGTIEVDIPQSVQYSTCLVHSAASAQSELLDHGYHDPENANLIPRKPIQKSPINDDFSQLNHPLFFSMPNLLTDSGIGFDEYYCLPSNEFSSKDNYRHTATEFSVLGDEDAAKKCTVFNRFLTFYDCSGL
uniref:Fibronectin type-III domain-containing protein n=1 Tax=Romanomermis culicivorax TaxID=13658 RepID=A0A915JSB1_ROMCU